MKCDYNIGHATATGEFNRNQVGGAQLVDLKNAMGQL